MATSENFQLLSDFLETQAEEAWLKNNDAPPLIAILIDQEYAPEPHRGQGNLIMAINVSEIQNSGDAGKDVIASLLHKYAEKGGVLAVAYMSESWMVTKPNDVAYETIRPSDDPEKTEALTIILYANKEEKVIIWPLTKDSIKGKRPNKEAFDSNALFGGRFLNTKNKTMH